ncbi:MAG: serine/threonine protein kinase, partial [Micromonosporaceae bacterium]|nr:serine/threonine protein kinase [Micromonosporaceae bacterium]
MGTVWRGYDEMLHRPVAVKELHLPAQLGDDARAEAIARAVTEARYAARLQHPGIVAVYDIVEYDGRPWIVMQLVEGVSLFQYVQQYGPMQPAEAARIGLAMLDALSAAHAAGVVHRDVKPSNVLLGQRGEVLLTDFSIAFAVGSVTMTNTGVVLGSPGYVAPERVARGRTGPAADLFGLGATLFFLVEGYGPFDNDDPLAGLLASATQPHPRPRNAGPLTPVIDGLLVKDPAQRMTAQAAAEALGAIVGGRGAPPPAPAPPPRPPGRRAP